MKAVVSQKRRRGFAGPFECVELSDQKILLGEIGNLLLDRIVDQKSSLDLEAVLVVSPGRHAVYDAGRVPRLQTGVPVRLFVRSGALLHAGSGLLIDADIAQIFGVKDSVRVGESTWLGERIRASLAFSS